MTNRPSNAKLNLESIPKWKHSDEKLSRSFRFNTFLDAIDFFQQVAAYCEKVDHHPNWENCYRDVSVRLWTHDKNTVTQKDIELAKVMDEVAKKLL